METVIDWSKAPDWAVAYAQVIYEHETAAKDFAWVCAEGYNVNPFGKTEQVCHPYMKQFFTADRFRLIEFRPSKAQAWPAEGLPPVGTVCEFAGFNPEETLPTDPRVGDQVTVIAHFMSGCFEVAAFTFYAPPEFKYLQVAQGAYGCFRPIRTPEQIAAGERYKELQEFTHQIYCDIQMEPRNAELLFNRGYRKKVAP